MEHNSTYSDPTPADVSLDRLATHAADIGYEMVDVNGYLEEMTDRTEALLSQLREVREGSGKVLQMNASVMTTIQEAYRELEETQDRFLNELETSQRVGSLSETVLGWVNTLDTRTRDVESVLSDVQTSNDQISDIAAQVNMLAINAKIEAARAGETGRGFSVVADAINALSQQTGTAAETVGENIQRLVDWITRLQGEASSINTASRELSDLTRQSQKMGLEVREAFDRTVSRMKLVRDDAVDADAALREYTPRISNTFEIVRTSAEGVQDVHERIQDLVDLTELMVQDSVCAGGDSGDAIFIRDVRDRADQISSCLSRAVDDGNISLQDLFDTEYRAIPQSNPEQFMTRFTALTEALFPDIQEAALAIDERVIFCAAVDRNGYLPTHNRKFSHPQGEDPVWNMANCRNRRIFDDRVGLKAGRNQNPFLLQVYRRDMGGGEFVMLKDLSAPILVKGRHWGGLRLAYRF